MPNSVAINLSTVGIRCLSENSTHDGLFTCPAPKKSLYLWKGKPHICDSVAEQVGDAKSLNKALDDEGNVYRAFGYGDSRNENGTKDLLLISFPFLSTRFPIFHEKVAGMDVR